MPHEAHSIRGVPCWFWNSLTIKTLSFEVDQVDPITVGEAAELLDVSRKTITNHATAGRFEGAYKDRDHGGQWRIPRAEVERVKREKDHDPREKPGKKPREGAAGSTDLVDELRDQVRYLRDQLDQERQAHAEARRIIGGLVQRIPELEASSSEARESDMNPGPTPTPTNTATGPHTSPQGPMRGLWRRFFGG